MTDAGPYPGLIEKYRDRLPVKAGARVITLCEGNTPLVRLENIPDAAGVEAEIYVKFEGLNPTGSFKDRGMTLAVTKAVEEGSKALICASTGNTSASAAALVRDMAAEMPLTVVNSINPYRLQGQKTVSFEIVEALGRAPDYHCLPVGNAGNISAHWIGYSECCVETRNSVTSACTLCSGQCPYIAAQQVSTRPIMAGYQASGAAPFLRGAPVAKPETVATAIRIGNPQSWDQAHAATRESGGWFDELGDDEILAMQRQLASREGIFCEPASAISVAGAIRDLKRGKIPAGSLVVCTVTGHGLKDPDTASRECDAPIITVDAEAGAVQRAILDNLN
jgi:threonine synthase